ncbi:MAG: LysM domain-containing protein [Verrucomicrobia bacterium]|nr:LysM domain-containing protein [Verrucomicrobiota bacterium]
MLTLAPAASVLAPVPQETAPTHPAITSTNDFLVQPEPIVYTVRKGDSLSGIAKRYRVGVEDILLINPMDDPDFLIPGQILRVPQKPKAP